MNYRMFRIKISNPDLAMRLKNSAVTRNSLGYYELGRIKDGIAYYIPGRNQYSYGYLEFLIPKRVTRGSMTECMSDFLRANFY